MRRALASILLAAAMLLGLAVTPAHAVEAHNVYGDNFDTDWNYNWAPSTCAGAYNIVIGWHDWGSGVTVEEISVRTYGGGRLARVWINAGYNPATGQPYRIWGHSDGRDWWPGAGGDTWVSFFPHAYVGSFQGLYVAVQVWNPEVTQLSGNCEYWIWDAP